MARLVPVTELARAAFLLAAHDPTAQRAPGTILERGAICRERSFLGKPALCWKHAIVSTESPDAEDELTPAEASELLEIDARPGQLVDVNIELLDLAATLAALAVEGGACERAAAHLGSTPEAVRAELKKAKLDVEARTLGGVAWSELPTEGTWQEIDVGPPESSPTEGRLPLAWAATLRPDARVGDRFSFSVNGKELDAFLSRFAAPKPAGWLSAGEVSAHRAGGIWPQHRLDEEEREAFSSWVEGIDQPRLQRLFDDAASRVVVFRCPGPRAYDLVTAARTRHASGEGWWPVVVGSDDDLSSTRGARGVLEPPRAPEKVLAKAALPATSAPAKLAPLSGAFEPEHDFVWIALVPVARSFEIPAHFQCWHNELPKAHVLVGLLADLEQRFGITVLEYRASTIVLDVPADTRLSSRDRNDVARRLAKLCPDIVEQGAGSVDELASILATTTRWPLWWD